MELFLAVTLGLLFGFALNRVGATNPQNIINMVRLTDLRLMKTILLAIGISSVLLFGGLMLGLVDPSHISVKSSYIGVIAGGVLLGAGFAIAGYCPGTGLAALATGRKDAFVFVIGGLVGAFVYTLSYGWIQANTMLFDKIAGGNLTLVATGNEKYEHLIPFFSGEVLGVAFGIGVIVLSFMVPKKLW
jgi:hypothetical protein